jgi:hypothetical protein
MYEWFIFSMVLLGIWFLLYMSRPKLRKEMMSLSIITSLVGLTEPIFVPAYWSPISLFDLNLKIGFDIESIIFCFAVGGISSILYEVTTGYESRKTKRLDRNTWFHFLSIASFPVIFILLLFTSINPIYSLIISMMIGGLTAVACRPDLAKLSIVGGLLFTILYFVFFLFINAVSPGFINSWNLAVLSGIMIFNIPIEELVFAFSFGMISSGFYEHVASHKIRRK